MAVIRRLADEGQLSRNLESVSPDEIDGTSKPFLQVHAACPQHRMERWVLLQQQQRASQDPVILPAGCENDDRTGASQGRSRATEIPRARAFLAAGPPLTRPERRECHSQDAAARGRSSPRPLPP